MIELDQRLYKPTEPATLFLRTERTVVNEMHRGRLPHIKLPSGRIFHPEHIVEYLKAREREANEHVERKKNQGARPAPEMKMPRVLQHEGGIKRFNNEENRDGNHVRRVCNRNAAY